MPCREKIGRRETLNLKYDLEKYFEGKVVDFLKHPVKLQLSDFSISVLEKVRKIPYGETLSYGEIAKILKTGPRAVGQALKRNPVPVIIPCHRIVGVKGIGGYSQGINLKKILLELEGNQILA
ncbi:MAG TPA: methylated-DNA--[protein]-cysteine S-methyltransferase [Archaeoglobaceae archaeon]|nr:methylated-DNA--[protein]-cysteine S-methyltransferase [Archaeoglobaceae archaeon]